MTKLWREKKKNPITVYPGLRYTHKKLNFACKIYFFRKCLFEYENQFAVEKTTKKFAAIKKMLAIHLRYMEIVWLENFWQKFFVFYLVRYTEFYAKIREKVVRKINETISAKCMKFVWLVFFHRLSLWNCMISFKFHGGQPARYFNRSLPALSKRENNRLYYNYNRTFSKVIINSKRQF